MRTKSKLRSFVISASVLLFLMVAARCFLSKAKKERNFLLSKNISLLRNSIDFYSEIKLLGDQQRTSYTTVVTTLFLFSKSKHSSKEYDLWSETMINSMAVPVVAFVDYNWAEVFISRCQKRNLTATVYLVGSVWDIVKALEDERNQSYAESYRTMQRPLDPNKDIDTPDHYAVWNIKHYLMAKVVLLNPYQSEFFIYTDSGAWRIREFPNWPDQDFIRVLNGKLADRVLYGKVGWPDLRYRTRKFSAIEGTFFAGSGKAIATAYANFYGMHDERLKAGMFVGNDQDIMEDLTFQFNTNSSIAVLRSTDCKCRFTYDVWFFYQYFFSQIRYYICKQERLSLIEL